MPKTAVRTLAFRHASSIIDPPPGPPWTVIHDRGRSVRFASSTARCRGVHGATASSRSPKTVRRSGEIISKNLPPHPFMNKMRSARISSFASNSLREKAREERIRWVRSCMGRSAKRSTMASSISSRLVRPLSRRVKGQKCVDQRSPTTSRRPPGVADDSHESCAGHRQEIMAFVPSSPARLRQ